MALKVAELLATLGLDAKSMDRTLRVELDKTKRAVAKGMGDAAKDGGDELVDGLERGARDSIDAMSRALDRGRSDVERVGIRTGEGFADAVERGAQSVDGIDASSLAGSASAFASEGSTLGEAFADGVSTGARSVSASIDPGSLGGSRSEFAAAGEQMGDALADGIEGGIESGTGSMDQAVGGFLDSLPAAMLGPATAAGAGLAAAIGIGMQEGLSSEATQKRLAASLNLDGVDASMVGETVSNLYAAGWERGQAAEAVQAVYAGLEESGASASALEDLSTQALAFADVFETDVVTAVELARTLVSEGLAKDATEAFDLMSTAMSSTDIFNRDELKDAVREYAKYFDGIGIDGPRALAILSEAAEGGSYALDATGDSIKEFGVIMRDMPDGARDALERMGLDVGDLQAKIAEGGPAAEDAFGQIVTAIQGIEDPLARGQAAAAVFGTPFENVTTDIEGVDTVLQSLVNGGMTDFEGASARNVEAVDTMQAKIDGYSNSLKETLGQAVGGAVLMVGGMFDEDMRDQWSEGWDNLRTLASTGALGTAADVVTALGDGARDATGTVFAWLGSIPGYVAAMPELISEAASGMWDGIKDAFKSAMNWVIEKWNGLSFTMPKIEAFGQTVGGWSLNTPDLPKFHMGGTVPGAIGAEMPIMALGGERILTIEQQRDLDAVLNADLSSALSGPRSGAMAAAAGGSSVDFRSLESKIERLADMAASAQPVSVHAPIHTTASAPATLREITMAAEAGVLVKDRRIGES